MAGEPRPKACMFPCRASDGAVSFQQSVNQKNTVVRTQKSDSWFVFDASPMKYDHILLRSDNV